MAKIPDDQFGLEYYRVKYSALDVLLFCLESHLVYAKTRAVESRESGSEIGLRRGQTTGSCGTYRLRVAQSW